VKDNFLSKAQLFRVWKNYNIVETYQLGIYWNLHFLY